MTQLVLWLFFFVLIFQLIACKTPAKKRNVRKIGKSAESLPLLPNKNKTEVKTAQEKTKEKPKTNEKAPAQEKPPTHEQSLSKDNPPSNSVDQAPGPPKEKSAVLDRTQKSQSTLNYKEYTAQSIEKSKDKKTKSAVEIKEKETKTAVEPKEKTNEKTKSALGLSPQVATGAEPSVTPTTTQTPAALITNSTQRSHKQIAD